MSTSLPRFLRHYVEMLVAMFAGMIVLGLPGEAALRLLGTSTADLKVDAPALVFAGMALTMTIPMVWLMRVRGHAWRPCWEMAASMAIPTIGVIALLWTGASEDFGLLMTLEHVVMLPAMLVAMLLRYDEYAGCGHTHHPATA